MVATAGVAPVFAVKADFLKSLAHPTRLAIIEELKDGERSVGQMARALRLGQPSLSKHLAVLRRSGVLVSRQEKVTVYYSLRDRAVFKVLRPVARILRRRLEESRRLLSRLGRA